MSAYLQESKSMAPKLPLLEEINTRECRISLRRIEGPRAVELFLSCQPTLDSSDAEDQTKAIYSALHDVLSSEGAGLNAVVSETLFLRFIERDIDAVRKARDEVVTSCVGSRVTPATTEIQQPPLNTRANVELAAQVVIPIAGSSRTQEISTPIASGPDAKANLITMDQEERLLSGGLTGEGITAYDQTWNMFETAESLLHEAGMTFKDVVRTWFYLSEMERDYYPGLNKARREFFDSRGIDPVPASTGIEGSMPHSKHHICMGFYAVKSCKSLKRVVMTTPTLNEAGEYGADFTRGMKMTEANKVTLHVSGTASIDETGRTAHVKDIAQQIDRMILNIRELLAKQGASFSDIVYAYNYLKDPSDEALLKAKFKEAGLEGFPSVFVHAAVCRTDLLCETEVLAILPLDRDPSRTKPTLLKAASHIIN